MMNNVILCDCDGVLLNWIEPFESWLSEKHGIEMKEGGHVKWDMDKRYAIDKERGLDLLRIFNESARVGWLPPHKDAIKYVKKLHREHGYVFHVITAMTSNHYAQKLRIANLERLFGRGVFDRFVFCDIGESKQKALSEYKNSGCFWIEDHYRNARAGEEEGLNPILMSWPHNTQYKDMMTYVDSWKDIYEIVA